MRLLWACDPRRLRCGGRDIGRRRRAQPPTAPGRAGCPIFPATNVWNKPVDHLPVAANSDAMIRAIGADDTVHPDFGSYLGYGIPYTVVSGKRTPKVKVSFEYAERVRSRRLPDPGAPEPGERAATGTSCSSTRTRAASTSCSTRAAAATTGRPARAPSGTCAPTACGPTAGRRPTPPGLPILPGLVRYDEVAAGAIRHALRFTAERTGEGPHLPGAPQRGRSDDRRCRRWACASGSRPRSTSPATASRRASCCQGAQDLRDDPGRQRQQLVHLGRQQPQATTTTSCAISRRSRARTSRSSTPRAAQRVSRGRRLPRTGDTSSPRAKRTMRTWAILRSLRPPCSFPSSSA